MLVYFVLSITIVVLAGCASNHSNAPVDTKIPRITTLKDVPIAGLLKVGSFKDMNYPQVWEEFFPIYDKMKHDSNAKFYGTMYWDANTPETADMQVSYMVGVPVKVLKSIDKPFEKHVIKGGEYAVFIHKGPVDKIMETYDYIYGTWFKNSGYKDRYGDVFEYYDERFKDQSPDSIVEIWIPIAKK